MVKKSNDTIIITAGELDEVMILLEASFSCTGDKSIFRIIEILMNETNESKIPQHDINARNFNQL